MVERCSNTFTNKREVINIVVLKWTTEEKYQRENVWIKFKVNIQTDKMNMLLQCVTSDFVTF